MTDHELILCIDCVGDSFLKNEITESGIEKNCSFCGDTGFSISLVDLADRIHDVLDECFIQTSTEPEGSEYYLAKEGLWERSGEMVEYVIQDIASVELNVAEAVREYLSDVHDAGGKHAYEVEQPYDEEAQYVESEIDTLNFAESWNFFKRDIRQRSRFFNQLAYNSLEHIFKNIESLKTRDGTSVIQVISPDDSDVPIYRARVAKSEAEVESILKGLPVELGPPPFQYAQSGRMNASGISVFYGALDMDTCIAEIRAPVGSAVVVGVFRPLRSFRLLNFSQLRKTFVIGSFFDSDYQEMLSRVTFLDQLVAELSAPILPGNDKHEYLSTQVVAEYFSQKDSLKLDGVMFKSSQADDQGVNVVLFNHACVLDEYKLPEGSSIEVSLGHGPPDDYDDGITIWERLSNSENTVDDKLKGRPYLFNSIGLSAAEQYNEVINVDPTLQLDIESLQVIMIKRVKYKYAPRSVSRSKVSARDEELF